MDSMQGLNMIAKRFIIQICFLVGLIGLTACNSVPKNLNAENLSFLTPIPENTLSAYRSGTPITNKLQAVIAARAFISNGAIRSLQTPVVVSADRMTLAAVRKKTFRPGESFYTDMPFYTPVWLVIFKADWQPDAQPPPPGQTVTPPPVYPGCQYVWMTENDNGMSATGSIACEIR